MNTQKNQLTNRLVIFLLGIYRIIVSPVLGPNKCRFEPTCSGYAIESFKTHSFFRACALTIKRVLKCHPLGGFGYDPVPEAINSPSVKGVQQ